MLIAWNFWDSIANGLTGLSLMLDGIVYWLVSLLFELYEQLAGFQFLTESAYNEIVDRFYVIIGVVMLFYLAYALLKALVNPDELTKSTSKIVMNIVVSLVLLNIVPIIFTYAYKLQHIIVSEDRIISKIVLGNANENISTVGRDTAMTFLESFLKPGPTAEISADGISYAEWEDLKICILDNKTEGCQGNEGFRHITLLANSVTAGDTEYTFIISTLCGAFLVYVIASFCLDLGVRVVKLAFYQIISPIPILMRIIPEKKSVFDNWIKATLATYLEVFIRLFIIYLITYLCTIIPDVIVNSLGEGDLGLFGTVVVLMGIFAFAKQAPKLIGDVIGVNAGNLKLGIKDKLATGGAFMAASALGGGATTGIRNLTHGIQNVAKAKGFGNKALAVFRTAGSLGTGMVSGAVRSGYGARGAKTYADVKKYAGDGASAAIKSRDKREAYKASHGGTFIGATKGHLSDAGASVMDFIGITSPLEQLKIEQSKAQEVKNARKAIDDRLSAIVERDQNTRKAVVAQSIKDDSTGHIFDFDNLGSLRNQIEIMKSTGKYTYTDAAGHTHTADVTADLLTKMNKAEFDLKKELKTEILKGYKKDGTRMAAGEFNSEYDSQLKELVTAYRTKTLQNINVLSENASSDAITQESLSRVKDRAVQLKSEELVDFVLKDENYDIIDKKNPTRTKNVTRSHIETLFTDGNDAISNVNTNINVKVAQKIEEEKKKKSS